MYKCKYCRKDMEFDDGWCSMHCNAMWNVKKMKFKRIINEIIEEDKLE